MAGSKRNRTVIDLTDEAPATAGRPAKSRRQNPSSAPGSSQPSSSAHNVEEPDAIDLTQDDGPQFELYGKLDNKIVGIRYYDGYATPGELVVCVREPGNPYDSNAIRVDNVQGDQIGHIPRTVASKLAPYLDANEITISAILTGAKGPFDCPTRIFIYGPPGPLARQQLETRLKHDKILKATELRETKAENDLARRRVIGLKSGLAPGGLPRGGAQEAGVSMEQLTQASQAVEMRSDADIIKTVAMDEDFMSKMPLADQPSILKATLLPYQRQGLAWMLAKENPQFPEPGAQESVQLWRRNARGNYENLATNFVVQRAPLLLSGGILADDMGLGKTIQTISLIMAGGEGKTLIVAPVSVMSNWEQQIQRHVLEEHAPKVLIYHGAGRQSDLSEFDVVVTSYGTMSSESDKGTLFKVDWRRIVLDEGHTIRNRRTKVAQAAGLLKAKSRWVLTGTPIINSVQDLHSLLSFLRITGGIENSAVFDAAIARPLARGQPGVEALLQALMQDLCLRRKKNMKFVDLKIPPKTEYIHRIAFWPEEKTKYDALLAEARGAMEQFQSHSVKGQKMRFQGVLERLLRLRQTCNHWTLCRARLNDLMELLEEEGAVVSLNPKNKALLQQALQLVVESQEECPVCIDDLKDPVITHCKHVFCRPCITKVIQVQAKCPMCRTKLSEEQLLEPAPEKSEEDEAAVFDTETKSSKTEALLKILQATLKKEGSKAIIFSQWTSFLTVIQRQLDEAGYTYTRIDGSMTAPKRDAAIQALDSDPKTRILLASLAVCSVGLNLVSADTVILADSWWAPAIEDQAVDRVHRLGQTRPTTVWRLVMEGSVEEQVLQIQADKRKLVAKAFQEKATKGQGNAKESRMGDVLKLLA